MNKAGFSLLEVILALAILAGAIAVLGEASRQGLRNAQFARDMAKAQLLCESKLAEIVAGITAAEPVDKAMFDLTMTDSLDPSEPAWLYSIETDPTEEVGLISVRVTVKRDLPPEQHPVQFSLVRWMPDPNATAAGESEQDSQSQSMSGSSAKVTSSGEGHG
jgi:prepilin-type N-terminal cleavage/methylation domain-containing protein